MKNNNPNKVKGMLKVGDTVRWCGGFGLDNPKEAVIESIEVDYNGTKNGSDTDSVDWNEVTRENVLVNLTNGHWAYGNQIEEI